MSNRSTSAPLLAIPCWLTFFFYLLVKLFFSHFFKTIFFSVSTFQMYKFFSEFKIFRTLFLRFFKFFSSKIKRFFVKPEKLFTRISDFSSWYFFANFFSFFVLFQVDFGFSSVFVACRFARILIFNTDFYSILSQFFK